MALYLAGLVATGSARLEHFVLIGTYLLLAYLPRSEAIARGLLPFFLFGVVYDAMRFITPFAHAHIPIHVRGPYDLDARLFGVHEADGRLVTPVEVLRDVDSRVLLYASGFAYFFYVYEVFLFGLFLLLRQRELAARFAWAFFVLSMLGFATWYAYPAAPPWYALRYGFGPVDLHVASDPARLLDVDALLGVHFFASFYARSSNVFGAVPSLHSAYPLLVFLYSMRSSLRRAWPLFLGFWLLMGFAAVFLTHHYVVDVLLGALYAVGAYYLVEALARRIPGAVPAGDLASSTETVGDPS